jgi:hypothetical protein
VAAIDAAAPGEAAAAPEEASPGASRGVLLGIAGVSLAAMGAGAAWLYRRWRRERNRPINRLRRPVRRAVAAPAWPAGGLGVALAALLLGRRLGARAAPGQPLERAADRLRDPARQGHAANVEDARARRGPIRRAAARVWRG